MAKKTWIHRLGILLAGTLLALSFGPAHAVDKIFIGILDDGTPVEGRTVTLLAKGGDPVGEATTDANGKARFSVAPGEYEAHVRSGFLGLMRHCVRVKVPKKNDDDDATFGPCDPGSSPASTAPEGSVSGDAEAVTVNLDIGDRDNTGSGSNSSASSSSTGAGLTSTPASGGAYDYDSDDSGGDGGGD